MTVKASLGAEMEEHLGYSKSEESSNRNSRNCYSGNFGLGLTYLKRIIRNDNLQLYVGSDVGYYWFTDKHKQVTIEEDGELTGLSGYNGNSSEDIVVYFFRQNYLRS